MFSYFFSSYFVFVSAAEHHAHARDELDIAAQQARDRVAEIAAGPIDTQRNAVAVGCATVVVRLDRKFLQIIPEEYSVCPTQTNTHTEHENSRPADPSMANAMLLPSDAPPLWCVLNEFIFLQ